MMLPCILSCGENGLVALTGCAHAGPINTLLHGREVTGATRVLGMVGGLHLRDAHSHRVERTLAEMEILDPRWLAPLHCTGLLPSARLALALPDAFRELAARDIIEYP